MITEHVRKYAMAGRTCYEIEADLGITHQSASGALANLEDEGAVWVPRMFGTALVPPRFEDDPRPRLTRPNQFGNDAQVYVHADFRPVLAPVPH